VGTFKGEVGCSGVCGVEGVYEHSRYFATQLPRGWCCKLRTYIITVVLGCANALAVRALPNPPSTGHTSGDFRPRRHAAGSGMLEAKECGPVGSIPTLPVHTQPTDVLCAFGALSSLYTLCGATSRCRLHRSADVHWLSIQCVVC